MARVYALYISTLFIKLTFNESFKGVINLMLAIDKVATRKRGEVQ